MSPFTIREFKKMTQEKEFVIKISKERVLNYLKLTLFGGIFVIAPIATMYFLFAWIFKKIYNLVYPMTNVLDKLFGFGDFFSTLIAIGVIIGSCFFTGLIVRTKAGAFIHNKVDATLLNVPGYSFVKELFKTFLSKDGINFADKKPVKFYPFGKDASFWHGFIMDTYEINENGTTTKWHAIYAPSCPTPATGFVYNCKDEDVEIIEAGGDIVLKSLTFCGIGTGDLYRNRDTKENSESKIVMNSSEYQ